MCAFLQFVWPYTRCKALYKTRRSCYLQTYLVAASMLLPLSLFLTFLLFAPSYGVVVSLPTKRFAMQPLTCPHLLVNTEGRGCAMATLTCVIVRTGMSPHLLPMTLSLIIPIHSLVGLLLFDNGNCFNACLQWVEISKLISQLNSRLEQGHYKHRHTCKIVNRIRENVC